jgi:hypothetical protein
MRLSSLTTKVPTHTENKRGQDGIGQRGVVPRTLFADERVVPVVGVIRITESSMGVLELEEFVAVLPGMASAARVSHAWVCGPRKSKNTRTSICGRCKQHITKHRDAKAKVT